MRDLWVADSETDPFKHGRIPKPFLWGLYNGSEYHQFERTEEVARFLEQREGVCYAHNGGKFDYHFLIQYAEPYDDVLVINGRIAKWKLGSMEMRDSMNILPIPLAAWEKESIDYALMEEDVRDRRDNRDKIERYLKSDCVNLWNLVHGFVDRYGMHLTQASASMKLWGKQSKITLKDSGAVFFDKFKPWYYGGRVQAFELGVKQETFYVADVNSAYPYAMLSNHPSGLGYDSAPGDRRNKIRGQDLYMVHGMARGCFPYRDGLKLHFPNDGIARTYRVTGHELAAAVELDLLRGRWEVLERIRFHDSITFVDYIMEHYEERRRAKETGDKAGALFSKLLMNSLYGKFGADPRRYTNHIITPAVITPVDDAAYPLTGYVGPWALVENTQKPINSRFYNVATAASITGYQRAHLLRQMRRCKGVLYCDTDSVVARDLGKIDEGSRLGQWTVEGEFRKWAIAGRKLYSFWGADGEIVKFASKGAKLYPADIERVARGETIRYLANEPTFSTLKPPGFVERDIRLTQ